MESLCDAVMLISYELEEVSSYTFTCACTLRMMNRTAFFNAQLLSYGNNC